MKAPTTSVVTEIFDCYPPNIRKKVYYLRALIYQAATDLAAQGPLAPITETTKWGEPSFVIKGGSTIRIAWKEKTSAEYAMYFNCNTRLVDTFKELYGPLFQYQGNRAIVFTVQDSTPAAALIHCIRLALTYQQRKHLPLLGA